MKIMIIDCKKVVRIKLFIDIATHSCFICEHIGSEIELQDNLNRNTFFLVDHFNVEPYWGCFYMLIMCTLQSST